MNAHHRIDGLGDCRDCTYPDGRTSAEECVPRYTKQDIIKLLRESQDEIWRRNYRYDVMRWVRENL